MAQLLCGVNSSPDYYFLVYPKPASPHPGIAEELTFSAIPIAAQVRVRGIATRSLQDSPTAQLGWQDLQYSQRSYGADLCLERKNIP